MLPTQPDKLLVEQLWAQTDASLGTDLLIWKSPFRKWHKRIYHLKGGETLLGPEKHEMFKHFSSQIRDSPLRRDLLLTFQQMLHSSILVLKKQARCWACIETSILSSFQDIHTQEITRFLHEWWLICTQSVISTQRTVPITKLWKEFGKTIKAMFYGFEGKIPEYKFPKLPQQEWVLKEPSSHNRNDFAKIFALSSYRHFPPGDAEEERLTKEKFLKNVLSPPPIIDSSERVSKAAFISAKEIQFCAEARGFLKGKSSHLSISNSSCLEKTRTEGGKRKLILDELKAFMTSETKSTEEYYLPDMSLKTVSGMRYKSLDPDSKLEFGQADFSNSWLNPEKGGMKTSQLAQATFMVCQRELIKMGIIDGQLNATGKPYSTKIETVREPGAKIRIVTKASAFLVTYLQPAAHFFKELMSQDPTMEAGFKRAVQLFEWYKRYSRNPESQKEKKYKLLLADYETATDLIHRGIAKEILMKFLETLGLSKNRYLVSCFNIVLGPSEIDGELTQRGCPMGLPVSKIILHFLSKTINVLNKSLHKPRTLKELWNDPSGFAGDDIIDLEEDGKGADRFKTYASDIRACGLIESPDKTGVYARGGIYCENPIKIENSRFPPNIKDFDENTAFCDFVKIRLMTPETKPTRGDEEKNPIFGKSFSLARDLAWLPRDLEWLRHRAIWLFVRNHRDFIRENNEVPYNLFLPQYVGGLGLVPIDEKHQIELLTRVPLWHQGAIKQCLMHPERDGLYRTLASWSSPLLYERGMDFSDAETLEVYSVLRDYLPTVNVDQAFDLIGSDLEKSNFGYIQKYQTCLRRGYIDLLQAVKSSSSKNFWDEKQRAHRGWSTRPFSERTRIVKQYSATHGVLEEPIDFEDFKKVLTRNPRSLGTVLIHEDFATIAVDMVPVKLNLKGKDTGASVFLEIHNAQMFPA